MPRQDGDPIAFDPGQRPEVEHLGSPSAESETEDLPVEYVEAAGISGQTPVDSPRQDSAESSPFAWAPPNTPIVPWFWFYVIGLPLLALLLTVMYIVTDNGTMKIAGAGPNMTVRIDGQEIPSQNLDVPIVLRTGPHEIVVNRGETVLETRTFLIQRGEEFPLNLTDIANRPPRVQGGKQEASSSRPGATDRSPSESDSTHARSPVTAHPSKERQLPSPEPARLD